MLDTAAESVGAVSVPIDANGRAFRLADLLRAAVNAIEATMDAAMKQAQMATPTITITGPETQERYTELRDVVDQHCPVLDLFVNATPVSATIVKG